MDEDPEQQDGAIDVHFYFSEMGLNKWHKKSKARERFDKKTLTPPGLGEAGTRIGRANSYDLQASDTFNQKAPESLSPGPTPMQDRMQALPQTPLIGHQAS